MTNPVFHSSVPLATQLEEAKAWAKAQPKPVRLGLRQRALDRMLREKLIGPDGKPDPEVLRRYCLIEAMERMPHRGGET